MTHNAQGIYKNGKVRLQCWGKEARIKINSDGTNVYTLR